MAKGVQFTESAARRTAAAVKRVEAMRDDSARGKGPTSKTNLPRLCKNNSAVTAGALGTFTLYTGKPPAVTSITFEARAEVAITDPNTWCLAHHNGYEWYAAPLVIAGTGGGSGAPSIEFIVVSGGFGQIVNRTTGVTEAVGDVVELVNFQNAFTVQVGNVGGATLYDDGKYHIVWMTCDPLDQSPAPSALDQQSGLAASNESSAGGAANAAGSWTAGSPAIFQATYPH